LIKINIRNRIWY